METKHNVDMTIEKVEDVSEVIRNWLTMEPLSFNPDDFVYIEVVDNVLRIGRAKILKE